MHTFPVKIPIAFSFVAAFIAPFLTLLYTGFFIMDFSCSLTLFAPFLSVLDVLLALLFLSFTWANVFFFYLCRKSLSKEIPMSKLFSVVWTFFAFVAVTLSVLTPLVSVFNTNKIICFFWSVVFGVELVAGIFLGGILSCIAYRLKHRVLFALGIVFSLSCVFDYSGVRVIEPMVKSALVTEEYEENVSVESDLSTFMLSFFGLSLAEYESLDDESLFNLQEISLAFVVLFCAGVGIFIVVHSFSLASAYLFFALVFSECNSKKSGENLLKSTGDELKIC